MAEKSGAGGFEKIAGAADGFEETGIFGIDFDFFAEAADADVDTSWSHKMFAAPYRGEEFFPGEDASGVGSELIEKAEFEKAGGDGFVGAGN